MLDPKALAPGEEQHEWYMSKMRPHARLVQFDYRDIDGELFSCVRKSLADARVFVRARLMEKGRAIDQIPEAILFPWERKVKK